MSRKFDRLLEKATDSTLLEADWEMIMNCVDLVRCGEVSSKAAIASVGKRVQSDNPHVAHHALTVLEAMVKNCGQKVHKEVATKEFMEDLKHLTSACPEKVKEKILELLQCWAHAFRDNPEYRIVKDTHNLMKLEGHVFPVLRESDAMFVSEAAPEWVDADHCFRCNVQFTLINRKHHCRNCGQIFCDKCSSRCIALPHIGIEREVRVCETCFDRIKNPPSEPANKSESSASRECEQAKKLAGVSEKTEAELREEEEMALALALSQSEAEEKERQKYRTYSTKYVSSKVETSNNADNYSTTFNGVDNVPDTVEQDGGSDMENELARYLNRQYWEQIRIDQKQQQQQQNRRQSPTPSAPVANDLLDGQPEKEAVVVPSDSNGQPAVKPIEDDVDAFVAALNERLSAFVNRLKSNQARGRSVIGDSALQSAFMNLTSMHSQLLKYLKKVDERRGYYENLQDKLQQVRDAREAVDALRQEHEQKKQAELYEMQQLRHAQMVAKLEAMRIKKHEMLEQQRLAAIRKMEEEQRELEICKRLPVQPTMPLQQQTYTGVPSVAATPNYSSMQQPCPVPTDMSQQQVYPGVVMAGPQYAPVPPTQPAVFPYPSTCNYADPSVQRMMPPKDVYSQMNRPPPVMMNAPMMSMQPMADAYGQQPYMVGGYPSSVPASPHEYNYPVSGFVAQPGTPFPYTMAPPMGYPQNLAPNAIYRPPLANGQPAGYSALPCQQPLAPPPVGTLQQQQQPAVVEQPAEGQLISFD